MTDNVASLGFEVNSQPVKDATQDLKGIAPAAQSAGTAIDGLNKSFVGLGSAVKGTTFGGSSDPFAAMKAGIASANKDIASVAPSVKDMGAAISAAILKSVAAFDALKQGVTGANAPLATHKDAVDKAASAHGGLSTQSMAAFHSLRSMAEGAALGVSPLTALTQQLNHLSFAASGPGGITEAFAGVARMIGPTGLLLGGAAVAGALGAALAKVSDEVTRNKNDFGALTGSAKTGLDTYNAVRDVAHKTGADFDALKDAVAGASQGQALAADRNVIYANSADKSAKDIKKLAETFGELNKIMETSGATAETEKTVLGALGASFQKTGTLTAGAFQSIRESSLPLARALSNAFSFEDINKFQAQLERTPIPLKQLQDIIDRLKPSIDAAFDARPINTVEQSTRELGHAWNDLIKALADSGAVGVVAGAITGLGKGVKEISDSIPGMKDQFDSAKNSTKSWGDLIKVADDQNSLFGKSIEIDIGGGITKYVGLLSGGIQAAWNFEKEVGSALASLAQKAIAAGQATASAIARMSPGIGSQNNSAGQDLTANPGGAGTLNLGDLGGGTGGTTGGETVPNITAGGDMPAFASGTDSAPGGLATVNEQGGEIINLPSGSQVIPHDVSMQMAASAGAIQGLTTLQGQGIVSATPDPASQASIKQITDAISQSSIDITKQIAAGNDNIVTALKNLTGGASTVNPSTGLPVSSGSTSGSSISTKGLIGSGGLGLTPTGGGGFTAKGLNSDASDYAAFQKQLKEFETANQAGQQGGSFDPMYTRAYGGSIRGSRGSGDFPAGAPINPRSTVPVNQNYNPAGYNDGYNSGGFGGDPYTSAGYGSYISGEYGSDYGSGSTYSATGSTIYGASSGGSNYSSDYGGNSISGITGNDPNAINYGGGGVDMGYFATGGKFKVGGLDGIDKNFIGLHVTKGETVEIKPPGGVSVPNSVAMPASLMSPSPSPDPSIANTATTMTKNVTINVQAGIQADSFIRSRAQIARGI